MNNAEFDKVVKGCIDKIKSVLQKKSQEYSSSDDKLHNFDKAKDLMRCKTKEFALLGMLNKHLVSVIDMIEKFEKTGELPTINMIDEKIGDSINYFVLLKACFMEDIYNEENKETEKAGKEFAKAIRENPDKWIKMRKEIEQLEAQKPMDINEVCKQQQEAMVNSNNAKTATEVTIERQKQAFVANSLWNNPRKKLVVGILRKMLKPLFVWLTDNNRFVDYEKIKGILNMAELERDHVPDEFIKDIVVAIRLLDLPIEMQDRRNEIIADILKPPLTKFKVGDDVVPIFFAAWVDKWQVGRDMTIATIDIDTEDKTIYYYGMFAKCEEKDCFATKEEAEKECERRNKEIEKGSAKE